jgi:hypothetical protein
MAVCCLADLLPLQERDANHVDFHPAHKLRHLLLKLFHAEWLLKKRNGDDVAASARGPRKTGCRLLAANLRRVAASQAKDKFFYLPCGSLDSLAAVFLNMLVECFDGGAPLAP